MSHTEEQRAMAERDAREAEIMEENINIQQLERLAEEYFVDEKQILTYWNAFKSYDGDGSGDIDADELRRLLKDLGMQLGEEEIEDMIREVDTSGRGTIPFGDFVELMADPEGPLAQLLAETVSKGVIDPRQAKLKRRHAQVRKARDELAKRKRCKVIAKLRGCNREESMSMGSVGAAGVNAVAVSHDGLLIAVGDGKGHVVVYRWIPIWLREQPNFEESRSPVPHAAENQSRRSSVESDAAGENPTGFSRLASGDSGGTGSPVLGSPMAPLQDMTADRNDLFKEVAVLGHHHRVRCLAFAHSEIGPMVASGAADGRVRLWRQQGEGRLQVKVTEANLRRAKFGNEECYAVIRVGQTVVYGNTVLVERHISWDNAQGEEMNVRCSSESINVVLYVRPKLKERKSSIQMDVSTTKDMKGGAYQMITKTKERLLGKGLKPKVLDRVTVATSFADAGWFDPSNGAIGTVVQVLMGGLECVVEWDNIDLEAIKAKKRREKEEARAARQKVLEQLRIESDEATDGTDSDKGSQRGRSGGEGDEESEPEQQLFQASKEEEDEDLLEGPKDFPATREGAMPTGLGEKGRPGATGGSPVYALVLHSRAVAASSVFALKAAALTDLSEGGRGAWVELTSVDEEEQGGKEGSSPAKTPGDTPRTGSDGSLTRSPSGSFANRSPPPTPPTRALKKGSLARGASQLSLSSMVGMPMFNPRASFSQARQPSQTHLPQPSWKSSFRHEAPDRQESNASMGDGSDAMDEEIWGQTGAKYSGQIRLQARWVHYPRTWEWIGGSGGARHAGEVTGVQFVEAGGSSGGQEEDPILLSCSTRGCCRGWKVSWNGQAEEEATKWGDDGNMIEELMLQYRDSKANQAPSKAKPGKKDAEKGSRNSTAKGGRRRGSLFDDSFAGKGKRGPEQAHGRRGSLHKMPTAGPAGRSRRASMTDTEVAPLEKGKGSLRATSPEHSVSARSRENSVDGRASPEGRAEANASSKDPADGETGDSNATSENMGPVLRRRQSAVPGHAALQADPAPTGADLRPGSRGGWSGGWVAAMPEERPASRGSVVSATSNLSRATEDGIVPRRDSSGRGTRKQGKATRAAQDSATGINWAEGVLLDSDPLSVASLRSHVSAGSLDCIQKLRFGATTDIGRGLKGMCWSDLDAISAAGVVPGWVKRQRSQIPRTRKPWLILEGNNGAVCVWSPGVPASMPDPAESLEAQFVSAVAEEEDWIEEEDSPADAREEDRGDESDEDDSDHEADKDGEVVNEITGERQGVQVEDARYSGWSLETVVRAGSRMREPTTDEGWHRIAVSPIDEMFIAVSDGRLLELWHASSPSKGRPRGKAAPIKWERIASLAEHCDVIRSVGWREDGRLLASCDRSGAVRLWARAGDSGVSRVQKVALGSGGWVCTEALKLTSEDETECAANTLCFGTGPSKPYLFVGTEDETLWVLDTEGAAPFHQVPTVSMMAGLGVGQI